LPIINITAIYSDYNILTLHIKEPGLLSRYSDWLLAGRQRAQSLSPGRVKNFSLLQVACVAHPASYSMGTGALSPGVKWLGLEAEHSPSASTEVKKI
jgi:hypothetical protein